MYYINTDDLPNHEFAHGIIGESLERGIRISRNIYELRSEIVNKLKISLQNLRDNNIENPNSNTQIKDRFNKIIKAEHIEYTMDYSNKQTFNKSTLEDLRDLGYDLASNMIEYRKYKKMIEAMDTLIDNMDNDNLIHPELSIGKTNRMNYLNPALMNIPKEILWEVIESYNCDNVLYSVDIKQQEPWILINALEINNLKNLLNTDSDFYEALYEYLFDGETPNSWQRKEIKTIWNAMAYGASYETIKKMCKHMDGEFVYKYFMGIPEYKKYKGRAFGLAKKKVQKIKTFFGTELYAAEWNQGSLARVLMDLPIQGTGSDILALLIGRFIDSTYQEGLDELLSIYFTRHDELIIEASREIDGEVVTQYLKDNFEHTINDWEPFNVKISEISNNSIIEVSTLDME